MSALQLLRKQTAAWGIDLRDSDLEALSAYARLLAGYEAANVIGAREEPLILKDHILDSLSCLLSEAVLGARKLVDVGSGGGLPGIPLKLVRHDLQLTLVEATGKKAQFLRQAVNRLSIDNTEVVNARAEEIGHARQHRDSFDLAVARAVAPLAVLAEYCLPLLRQGGCLVAMKAALRQEEVEAGKKAARILGAELTEEIEVAFLPDTPIRQRRILVMEKTDPTPARYPRRTGLPKKRPLGY